MTKLKSLVAGMTEWMVFFTAVYIWIQDMKTISQGIADLCVIRVGVAEWLLNKYKIFKSGIELPVFYILSAIQCCLICTVFICIRGSGYMYGTMLVTGGIIITVIVGVILLDKLYQTLDQIADILEEQALAQSSIRQLFRVKRLAQRYREAGPVTGLGFFEVKLSIILAMASVTLTYMIFLLQSGP